MKIIGSTPIGKVLRDELFKDIQIASHTEFEASSEKHYPKFPKSKQEFRDRLDEERAMGYEDGNKNGFQLGEAWAKKDVQLKHQDIKRRAAIVALDCLETARVQVRDVRSMEDGPVVMQSLAQMMYATFKSLEMVK
jgi:hypothetical protein